MSRAVHRACTCGSGKTLKSSSYSTLQIRKLLRTPATDTIQVEMRFTHTALVLIIVSTPIIVVFTEDIFIYTVKLVVKFVINTAVC